MGDNIVISFSNKDRAFVEALSEQLDQRLRRYRTVRGAEDGDGRPKVWIYPQQTDGSRHIVEIHKQIDQALAVIVVLSEHSAASRWVLEEVQFAWNRNKFLIPVALGDRRVIRQSDPGLILETRTWNYADEADSAAVADSIVKTLEDEKLIRLAEIGNRYRHKRQLTTRPTGGFFEATRDDDDPLFVVKEVSSSDREVLRELDAKIARLRQLRNPALPLIEDYLQEEGRRYIVWEEVPGRHLGDVLAAQKDQPLAWADIQPWVADALTTLALLHQAKVLHLGLKPQNFKRTRDGQIKLLDLGLDRRPAGATATGTTDPYLAPELLDERDPSPRSDLYAAGAVLYTLLTGDRQPSPAKPPVAKRNREVPEHVSQAIAKAMSPEPAQRFRSANEFLVALESPQALVATPSKRPAWLLPAGAAALAGLLALALFVPEWLRGTQGANAPTVGAPTEAAPTSAPVAAAAVEITQAPAAAAGPSGPTVGGQEALDRPENFNAVMDLVLDGSTNGQVFDPQQGRIIKELRNSTVITLSDTNNRFGSAPLIDNLDDFILSTEVSWGEPSDQCEMGFRWNANGRYGAGIRPDGTVFAGRVDIDANGVAVWTDEKSELSSVSSALNIESNARNILVLVAKGDRIQIYINGSRLFNFTDSTHARGAILFTAYDYFSENTSPRPSCTFSNTWVWAPDKPAAGPVPEPTARPLPASFDAVMALVREDPTNAKVFDPQNGVTLEELPEPVTITLKDNRNRYGINKLSSDSPNFVLYANVAWGEKGDGCQLNFRENERGFLSVGIDPKGNVYAGRWENNQWNPLYYEAFAALKTKSGEINNLILVASGTKIQLYINNQRAFDQTVDWYERGAVGLVAANNGDPQAQPRPSCTFSDVWVWAPDAPAAAVIAPAPTAVPLPASFDAVMALVRKDAANARVFDPQAGQVVQQVVAPSTIMLNQLDNRYGDLKLHGEWDDFVFYTEIDFGEESDQCEFNVRQDGNGHYNLGIRPDAIAYAGRASPGSWQELANASTSHIVTGRKGRNIAVLVANNTRLQVYINNELVLEVDDVLPDKGYLWLSAYDFVDPNAAPRPSCTFSDVWLWAPDGP